MSFSDASYFGEWYSRNQADHKVHYQGDSQQEAGRVWKELNEARRLKEGLL